MKKLLSVLGALCMLCASIPTTPIPLQETAVISAVAEDSETAIDKNIRYSNYGDHIEIEGTTCMKDLFYGELVIPSEIEGLPVTAIKDYAFTFCKEMTAVIIPDTVTYIGNSAFADCKKLTSVTLPENLPVMGENVFRNTAWMEIPQENTLLIVDNVLLKATGSTGEIVIPDGVTAIASNAFCDCDELTAVIIPETVTSIGERAFFGCTSLGSVIIPDTVTNIGDYAFYDCHSLKSIRLPSNLTEIGIRVFEYSGLSEVIIPEGITKIGNGDFSCCTSLKSVVIPNSVTSIGADAFGGSRLESVTLPDGAVFIGSGAFYLTNLTSVTIPDNTKLENNPFSRCQYLTEIHISESNHNYTVQDGVLFSKDMTTLISCPASKNGEFVIPDTVTTIGEYAFLGCVELTSVVIPDSVTSIGELAFRDCHALTSVNLPSGVTEIAYGTFLSCNSLQSIEIPANIIKIGDNAFNFCTSLENVTILNPDCEIFDSINTFRNYKVVNGIVVDFDGTFSGYPNSSVQNYAENYGYHFETLETNVVLGDVDGSCSLPSKIQKNDTQNAKK